MIQKFIKPHSFKIRVGKGIEVNYWFSGFGENEISIFSISNPIYLGGVAIFFDTLHQFKCGQFSLTNNNKIWFQERIHDLWLRGYYAATNHNL